MSCVCQGCNKKYLVDIVVPNEIWEKIKPAGSTFGGGMLCPVCIAEEIIKIPGYSAFKLDSL